MVTIRCNHKPAYLHLQKGCRFYDFYQNLQNVRSDIAHFQVQPHPFLALGKLGGPSCANMVGSNTTRPM